VKVNTMGVPATPRDGAPIEITGLLASTLRWVCKMIKNQNNHFPYTYVTLNDGAQLTYAEWYDLLVKNFEEYYYIPKDSQDDHEYMIETKLVNRRGIYKDTFEGTHSFSNYQLRPNFMVAMVVAPELFAADHASTALELARTTLVAPLGVKTLDPQDWGFRGSYDNANDSDDATIAKGFNYHQGPEWGWPLGYYLRAQSIFDPNFDITKYLPPLQSHLKTATYAGLPELTHPNGAYCSDSCPTQAWSAATILDALYDVNSHS